MEEKNARLVVTSLVLGLDKKRWKWFILQNLHGIVFCLCFVSTCFCPQLVKLISWVLLLFLVHLEQRFSSVSFTQLFESTIEKNFFWQSDVESSVFSLLFTLISIVFQCEGLDTEVLHPYFLTPIYRILPINSPPPKNSLPPFSPRRHRMKVSHLTDLNSKETSLKKILSLQS